MFLAQLGNPVWAKLGPEPSARPADSGTFVWAPFRHFFSASCFAACPGNPTNNVDPADPTLFFAFLGNPKNNVESAGADIIF